MRVPRWFLFIVLFLMSSIAIAPIQTATFARHPTSIGPPETIAAPIDRDRLDLGRQLYETGQIDAAIEVWERVAREGNSRDAALAYSALAIAYYDAGQVDAAERSLAQGADLLPQVGDSFVRARWLQTRGTLEFNRGNPQAALDTWDEAIAIYREIGDRDGAIAVTIDRAQALQALGLYRQAQKSLEHLERQLENSANSLLKASTLRSLGAVLQVVGDRDRAEAVLTTSLHLAQQFDDPIAEAESLFQLGNNARLQQQTDAAIAFYDRAATTSPIRLLQVQARLNQLNLLVASDRQEAAIALIPSIIGAFDELPRSRSLIYARVNFAETAMQTATWEYPVDPREIAAILARGIDEARQIGDRRAEAYALGHLGVLYERQGQYSEAIALTRQGLQWASTSDAADLAASWHAQHGRLLAATGQSEEAIVAYEQAVQALESLRQDLVAVHSDVRFSFRERVEPIYRAYVSLLLENVDRLPLEKQQVRLQKSRQAIEALQLRELENFFREACKTYQLQPIEDIDPQAALIYPIVLENRIDVIVSLPGQPLAHYATSVSFEERKEVFGDTFAALNPVFPIFRIIQPARQLYDWLIRPAEPLLEQANIQTLVFVLDGFLRNLPMSALYDGEQFLIEKYRIALTPGLQLLELPSQLSQNRAMLTGGLAEARQGFSALPGVAVEIRALDSLLSPKILLNEEFTKASLSQSLESNLFSIVHLATHGQFSSEAEQTFLLTWNDRIQVKDLDKILQEQRDRAPIELLVLSACQTAFGDDRAALGLAGVAVRSGARSTLATLWSVQDRSTAELMAQFYRLLKEGFTKGEALRQAQLFLLKQEQYRHPYYWSPFVLVGHWQ
ncbi:MAG: CHAT domain-containing protein [Cyanobacteria bacterium J007]|nr:MAG: CHAT domain-containing protein [Cyanobacteria bacterium J007]